LTRTQLGADGRVSLVSDAAAGAGVVLDQAPVAGLGERPGAAGGQCDALHRPALFSRGSADDHLCGLTVHVTSDYSRKKNSARLAGETRRQLAVARPAIREHDLRPRGCARAPAAALG